MRCECLLLTLGVKVYPAHFTLDLVEADIVEALKAGATDGAHSVIGDQEMFFPPHENVLTLRHITDAHRSLSSLFLKGAERRKLAPVVEVDFVGGTPGIVVCEKVVFGADDLAFKVCRQSRMIFSEACDSCVSSGQPGLDRRADLGSGDNHREKTPSGRRA